MKNPYYFAGVITGAAYTLALLCFGLGLLIPDPTTALIGMFTTIYLMVMPYVCRYLAVAQDLRKHGESWTDRDWHYIRTGESPRDESEVSE